MYEYYCVLEDFENVLYMYVHILERIEKIIILIKNPKIDMRIKRRSIPSSLSLTLQCGTRYYVTQYSL